MPTIRKHLELNAESVTWFYDVYGSNASLSWILDLLLEKFKAAHEKTPAEYAEIGAVALRNSLMEGHE